MDYTRPFHIAFSPVTMSDGTKDWYGLGPVSVHPDVQRQGIPEAAASVCRWRSGRSVSKTGFQRISRGTNMSEMSTGLRVIPIDPRVLGLCAKAPRCWRAWWYVGAVANGCLRCIVIMAGVCVMSVSVDTYGIGTASAKQSAGNRSMRRSVGWCCRR